MRFTTILYIIILHISQIYTLSCIQNGESFKCLANDICFRNLDTTNCKAEKLCTNNETVCGDASKGPCCCSHDDCNKIKLEPNNSIGLPGIIGIVAGVVAFLVIVVFCCYLYRKRRREALLSDTQQSDPECSPIAKTKSETKELLPQSQVSFQEEASRPIEMEISHRDRENEIIDPLTSKTTKHEILDSLTGKIPSTVFGVDEITEEAKLDLIETFGTNNTITTLEHVIQESKDEVFDDRSMCIHILHRLLRYGPRETPFEVKEIKAVLKAATKVLSEESSLLKIKVPAIIYGDIHGQYSDLLRWLNLNGWPYKTRSVFLGDFVDRGSHGIEVVVMISCLKVLYPENIFLCRGNHEEENLNKAYSFFNEVEARFAGSEENVYKYFKDLFNHLPLAALIGGRILGMHGGLSPHLKNLADIEEIERPIEEFVNGTLACDLVWSDPNLGIIVNDEYKPNYEREPRAGIGQLFSVEAVKHACDSLGVDIIIRGHQVPSQGYGRWANGRLYTLFSAPGYKGFKPPNINMGACIKVQTDGKLTIKRKTEQDLGPLNRLIHSSIVSLSPIYTRRNISAENWRRADLLSLTVNPQQIHFAAQTDVISCEYLSLDVMDRWILYCATLCHNPLLNNEIVQRLWQITLEMGLCIRIFRDEVFIMHQELQVFFDSFKGLHKRSQEVKDYYSIALQQSAAIHADRRRFLRTTLRELTLLLQDQPGLLGPKILFVWMGLSFSRDEIMWLLRHINEWPSSKKGNKGVDELQDKQLPELIHYVLELRDLIIKYSGVIQIYYLQYVANYDAFAACEVISSCNGLSEYDAVILSDFADSISRINSDTDLRALRLDWFRFQAHTSFARSTFSLHQQGNKKLAIIMNTNVFHLKMIDLQDEMLRDLSIYCFYPRELERQWRSCLQLPGQSRFALAFARLAAHFNSALHDICPEEKVHIIEKALNVCATVLDDICHTVSEVVGNLCVYELRLSEQTSTSQVAQMLAQQMQKGKGGKNAAPQKDFITAGEESHRTDRQRLTYSDKLQTTLVELCAGLSHSKQLTVAEHIFAPREYLAQHLENRFVEMILETAAIDASIPRRPSELLMAIQSFMSVLQNIDTCVALDITLIFNSALLQQSQPQDSRNRETLTAIYTKWYLEVVLRRASTSLMVWSEHLQALVSYADANPFSPEQYTDPLELRSLAQILGPYGVKYFSERLIWHVACQITELHKVIIANKEVLQSARSQFDNSEKLKEIIGIMSTEQKDKKNANNPCPSGCVLQRTAIMGEIFMLRDALRNALKQVLAQRLPFLTAAFNNLHESLDDEGKAMVAELAAAMGIAGKVDMSLVNTLRAQNPNMHQGEFYMLSCLLLVAIAISLPRVSISENSSYKPSIKGTMSLPAVLRTGT